jgi:hypothetical protein
MPELTAEIVRSIVKEEVQGLRQEMNDGFADVRRDFGDAMDRIVATMQSLHEETEDQIASIGGRLDSHNHRIAKLERQAGWRA